MPQLPALPAELTIYTVGDLHRAWLSALPEIDAPLTVPAGAVNEVDAAGLQLLVALRRHCLQHGQPLLLDQPSHALTQAATALGLHTLLLQPANPMELAA
jgi:anti-anti-sigma regulatory factor